MKKTLGVNVLIILCGSLVVFSILEPLNYFLSFFANTNTLLVLDVFVFVLTYLLFYPVTTLFYETLYNHHLKRLIRASLIAAIAVSFGYFIITYSSGIMGRTFGPFQSGMYQAQFWIYTCIILAVTMSYIDAHKYFLPPYIISGIALSIVLSAIQIFGTYLSVSNHILLIVNLVMSFAALRVLIAYFTLKNKLPKIRILNGHLRNYVFNLYDSVSVIGNQMGDAVNLNGYQEINYSHAKIINYGNVYSLSDNDPYCRTLLNSSRVSERILKNRDIITIGSAKLLFLYK